MQILAVVLAAARGRSADGQGDQFQQRREHRVGPECVQADGALPPPVLPLGQREYRARGHHLATGRLELDALVGGQAVADRDVRRLGRVDVEAAAARDDRAEVRGDQGSCAIFTDRSTTQAPPTR